MLEGVARQGGVVGLNVHLEILVQPVLAHKADRRCGIKIILVLHGLLWLGFNEEIARKADGAAVADRHFHQRGDVLLLKLHVGVQQRFIALSASPEHITPAAELHRAFQRLFDLCGRVAVYLHAVGGARAVHKAGIAKHIGRAPQALYAGCVHLLPDIVGDFIQARVCFGNGIGLGHQVHIVEAEIFYPQLLHKLKARIHLGACVRHRARLRAEAFIGRPRAEHIRARRAQVMPPRHGERQVLLHGLAHNHAVGIIIFERERIFGF